MANKKQQYRTKPIRLVMMVDEHEREVFQRMADKEHLPITTAMRTALLKLAETQEAQRGQAA